MHDRWLWLRAINRATRRDVGPFTLRHPPGSGAITGGDRELRKNYHKQVEQRLAGEIDKDLTGHMIADIEKALLATGRLFGA